MPGVPDISVMARNGIPPSNNVSMASQNVTMLGVSLSFYGKRKITSSYTWQHFNTGKYNTAIHVNPLHIHLGLTEIILYL